MGIEIKVVIEDEKVKDMLSALSRRMENLTPVMREIGEIVRESVMLNFEQQRSPEGARWFPSTRAILTGGKTLTDTATLKNSIHVQAFRDKAEVGTPVRYAATHQFGAKKGAFGTVAARIKAHMRKSVKGISYPVSAHTRQMQIPWGSIPARPFLGVRDEDWEEIRDALTDYLFASA